VSEIISQRTLRCIKQSTSQRLFAENLALHPLACVDIFNNCCLSNPCFTLCIALATIAIYSHVASLHSTYSTPFYQKMIK